ncbi:DNA polymerase IV [Kordia sp. SMS9]|uniref:Y-family DNA polymerase n=1 Tax=Kordia sp. SMS9 TaxID=2282170 RepID=UPI000E0CC133|nr:Y-family DNA polymerase [Kordia sp. SMS9]AXG68188.1 DNA polymerase IV [Kordia sp. SMS9]
MYALVDVNNMYCSCERIFNPALNKKPVVVLSNNDGCVISRSNEAKALGIPMGAVAHLFEKTFKENNVLIYSSNYSLYGDMSDRLMQILSDYTPDVEVYSIDEAFLHFKGFKRFNFDEIGIDIKNTVARGLGLPISIGIAPTKALAKVANKIAKKFSNQTNGVYVMNSDLKRIKALKWLNVDDIWGIGRRHAQKLNRYGITKAIQFVDAHDNWVRKEFSVVGLRLKKDLQGIPTLGLGEVQNKKSIAVTRSFAKIKSDINDLQEIISSYACVTAEKLRHQKSCCNLIMVFVRTNPFKNDKPQYSNNVVLKLPYPTNSSIVLAKYAKHGVQQIFKKDYEYKKAGVIVMGLVPDTAKQLNMFEPVNADHSKLMATMDKMNTKYGKNTLNVASQKLDSPWAMRQNHLSPNYTTDLNEIITVNCNF